EEEIHDRRAAQRRHLLDRPLADLLERLGGVENQPDLLAAERLESQEILAERMRHALASRFAMTTPFFPSVSATRPSTRCDGGAEIVLPTMSGWIGSSRPPRSMSTARAIRRGRPKSASSSSAARIVRPV